MKDATAKVAATQIVLENLSRLLPAASRQALLTGNHEKAKLLTEMISKYLHDLKTPLINIKSSALWRYSISLLITPSRSKNTALCLLCFIAVKKG